MEPVKEYYFVGGTPMRATHTRNTKVLTESMKDNRTGRCPKRTTPVTEVQHVVTEVAARQRRSSQQTRMRTCTVGRRMKKKPEGVREIGHWDLDTRATNEIVARHVPNGTRDRNGGEKQESSFVTVKRGKYL